MHAYNRNRPTSLKNKRTYRNTDRKVDEKKRQLYNCKEIIVIILILFLIYKMFFSLWFYYRCLRFGLCYGTMSKCYAFLRRDSDLCIPNCKYPLDPVKLSQHCLKSDFRSFKVNYLCRLEWLTPLLHSNDVNLKVIHLVIIYRIKKSKELMRENYLEDRLVKMNVVDVYMMWQS